jgi:hypothetical protein
MADFGYIMWEARMRETEDGRQALDKIQRLEAEVREHTRKIGEQRREIYMLKALTDADEKKRIGYFFKSIEFQAGKIFDSDALDGYCDRMYEFRNWKDKDNKYKFRRAVSEVLSMPYVFLNPEYKV